MAVDMNINYRELDQKEMGKRIRDRREAMGLSREDLSELLDVSSQFIADVEYGNKGLSIKRLYLLSQVLGVTSDYILAGTLNTNEGDGTATRFREEIMELIYKCDAKQLKGIREITEIYVDGVNSK
ncbi:MAG: helix-turn-helix transcriptional regulator [Firmicutes bacterium]|nr:helix-turn-helix transcriptional regulator [Bacillota bacterium]